MSELFKLKNGTVLVSTEAPGGIYNSAQLKKIAELCSKELAIVKATEDQRLALFVKESEIDRVIGELKSTGLGFRNYQSGLHQPVSCIGELCESHEQPALATAMDLTRLIADINLTSPLKIGINGCARCCTPCHTLDISVIGEASGYRVSLGGKTSQFPELASFFAEAVPAKELPKLLATVVELFKVKAEPGETFHEVLDRAGSEEFVAALAPYSQDAAHRDDPFAVSGEEGSEAEVTEDAKASEEEDFTQDSEMEALDTEADLSLDAIDEPLMIEEDDLSSASLANESDDEPLLTEDVTGTPNTEELEFDFSKDDDAIGTMDEVQISDSSEKALSDDILVHGGEERGLEDDAELIFEDETLMSHDLLASEPELIEEGTMVISDDEPSLESEEISADVESGMDEELIVDDAELPVPELSEESLDMPELGEELLETSAIESPESLLLEEEGEGDAMNSEEEMAFEERLKASIEEDKKLRDAAMEDVNQSARADALKLIESAGEDEGVALSDELSATGDSDALDESESESEAWENTEIDDVELELISDEDVLEAPKAKESKPSPEAKSKVEKKIVARSDEQDEDEGDFEGFDLIDHSLRVSFHSGATLDFALDSLRLGKSRVFRAGEATIRVTHDEGGYRVEGGGMTMFYPHAILKAAS